MKKFYETLRTSFNPKTFKQYEKVKVFDTLEAALEYAKRYSRDCGKCHFTGMDVYECFDEDDDCTAFSINMLAYGNNSRKLYVAGSDCVLRSCEQEESSETECKDVVAESEADYTMKKMSYEEFDKMMCEANGNEEMLLGAIVFTEDSFIQKYSEEERTYLVSSFEKHYKAGSTSDSLVGDCLDGNDDGVRLDKCMKLDGWKPEFCYLISCKTCKYARHSAFNGWVCDNGWGENGADIDDCTFRCGCCGWKRKE